MWKVATFVVGLVMFVGCHHGIIREENSLRVDAKCKSAIGHLYSIGCIQIFRKKLEPEKVAIAKCDFVMEVAPQISSRCYIAFSNLVDCWEQTQVCEECNAFREKFLLECSSAHL